MASQAPRHRLFRGNDCRSNDKHPAPILFWVDNLLRVLAVLLLLLMILQVVLGLTSAVEISYGVLAGEAIRLLVLAGVLWAAADLADVVVKSHCDLLAIREWLTSGDRARPPRDEPPR